MQYSTLALQRHLKAQGFYRGKVDGIVGQQTIQAIKDYQAANGLRVDGVMGPKTLRAMGFVLHVMADVPALVSSACVDMVKAWEGIEDGDTRTVELEPYICPAQVVTVGWGHALLDERGRQIKPATHGGTRAALAAGREAMMRMFGKPGITRDEAKALLATDINTFAQAIANNLATVARKATQCEFDAMVSLAFNIGLAGFAKSSVRRLFVAGRGIGVIKFEEVQRASRAGATPTTMEGAFAAWSRGGGVWLLGLYRRRMCEAMFFRGDALASCLRTSQTLRKL